jgi:hypothetical protein
MSYTRIPIIKSNTCLTFYVGDLDTFIVVEQTASHRIYTYMGRFIYSNFLWDPDNVKFKPIDRNIKKAICETLKDKKNIGILPNTIRGHTIMIEKKYLICGDKVPCVLDVHCSPVPEKTYDEILSSILRGQIDDLPLEDDHPVAIDIIVEILYEFKKDLNDMRQTLNSYIQTTELSSLEHS